MQKLNFTYILSIVAAPGLPQNICKCTIDDDTIKLCISWSKPDGGDAILGYLVSWACDDNHDNAFLKHDAEESRYNFSIGELIPGCNVSVNVTANNSAEYGVTASRIYSTCKCAYLKLKEPATSLTRLLDPSIPGNVTFLSEMMEIVVEWNQPLGNFDEIIVESIDGAFEVIMAISLF